MALKSARGDSGLPVRTLDGEQRCVITSEHAQRCSGLPQMAMLVACEDRERGKDVVAGAGINRRG